MWGTDSDDSRPTSPNVQEEQSDASLNQDGRESTNSDEDSSIIGMYISTSSIILCFSDAPTGRIGQTVGSVSDNQWVQSVLAKNYRTLNSSVVLLF